MKNPTENQIQHINPLDLVPYSRNSRTHSDEQIAQVANSIQEFGFTNPILIDENKQIIAGHGRHLAAKKLNLRTVPVIQLTHLDDNQKRAYVIADNKIALNAGWDNEILDLEMTELESLGFDMGIIGFDLNQELISNQTENEDEYESDNDLDNVLFPNQIEKKPDQKYEITDKIRDTYKMLINKSAASFIEIVQSLPKKGEQINIVTTKSFNAISVVSHLFKTENVKEIYIAIYRMNLRSVDFIKLLFKDENIKGTIIFSSFFKENKRYEQWVEELLALNNGNITVKTAWLHAKISMIKTEKDFFVFDGSGNVSDNARIEQYSLTNDKNLFNFHKNWMNKIKC